MDNFCYTFTPGVYGLLGPNGAGKSTLMNMITDNLPPTSGSICADGTDISDMGASYRRLLGFMPQQQSLYSNFTLGRFLWYMAGLKGLKKDEAKREIDRLLRLVNLEDSAGKRLGGFSGGMKQRALVAQAMLGNPQIIILDEPTAGLDPKERIRIRNLIAEIAFEKIVIIATHVVPDIEYIAKEVLMLKKGVLIDSGTPYKLCEKMNGKVFEITAKEEQLSGIAAAMKVGSIAKDENEIFVRVIAEQAPQAFAYRICKPELEDLYLYYFD